MVDFTRYHVIKMPRIFQSVFYFLNFTREELCERATNKLDWKKAKTFLNDEFFFRLSQYNPFGPKEDEFKMYQKLAFIERNTAGVEPEQVDEYSVALGKIYRWMQYCIEVRKEDVQARRELKKKLREEREAAQTEKEERAARREKELEEARNVNILKFSIRIGLH